VPADAASREGDQLVHAAFGPGAGAPLSIVVPGGPELERAATVVARDPGIAAVAPVERAGDRALITAVPASSPGSAGLRATLDRLRRTLPPRALVGGATAESRDVERALLSRLPLVIGLVVAIGFALLAALLRSPLAAAAAVAMNVLASAAAFGVARLVFQDGALAGPLGFESQGFVDAWAPIFFSALLFALAMDYSVFMLSAFREHRRRGDDVRAATVEALAGTGRIINAAAAVMIGVFASFALAGPLPVKEMGVILAVGVLLDTLLVRLVLQPVILRLAHLSGGRAGVAAIAAD
jgi:RND superfamily putative drug exporter